MRVEPSEKAIRGNIPDAAMKARIEHITRIIAIVIAFATTFGLMLKILFF